MRRGIWRVVAITGLTLLTAVALAAPAGAKTKTKTFSNPTPVPIPDATPGLNGVPGAVFDDLSISKKGFVKNLKAGVQITHTDTSDLEIWLFKGEVYIPLSFFESGGPSSANMGSGTGCAGGITVFDSAAPLGIFYGDNPFDGSFRPALNARPMSVFNNLQLKGTWRLLVIDTDPPPPVQTGTINCLQITAKYKTG